MKKYFKSLSLALAIACTGGVVTSCDSDTIAQLIPLITSLFDRGQTYNFTGSATSQAFTSTDGGHSFNYLYATEENPDALFEFASGVPVSLTCTSESTASITLPDYTETEGGVSVEGFTLGNLALDVSEDQTYNTLELTEETTIAGTMTYDGVTYTAYTALISSSKATEDSLKLDISMFFQGPDDKDGSYSKGVRFKYTGAAATTAQ